MPDVEKTYFFYLHYFIKFHHIFKDVISPTPVTSQLDGVRVKLNYDKYADLISDVVIDGKKLSELAEIKKSFMYDYILVKINSESSLVEDSN